MKAPMMLSALTEKLRLNSFEIFPPE